MTLIFYWASTKSIDQNCERLWFLVSKQWPVNVQGYDMEYCSWITLTVKQVYLCIKLCWHPKWPDMSVVFLLVKTVDLYCLNRVECCFTDFTLRRWVVVCSLLIWSCILLLCPWSNCCLYTLFMDFCRIWLSHVLLPFHRHAATLQMSLLPTLVAFSILEWTVLLRVWWCCSTAVRGFAPTLAWTPWTSVLCSWSLFANWCILLLLLWKDDSRLILEHSIY